MENPKNIKCNVIRDLLPLYADSVLSADSAAIVVAHFVPLHKEAAELLFQVISSCYKKARCDRLFEITIRCQDRY